MFFHSSLGRWGGGCAPVTRIGGSALLSLLLLLSLGALPAFAGDLRVQAHVRGAGTVTYGFPAASCNMTWNLDERVSQYCGQRVNAGIGSVGGLIFATPAASPAGDWEFVRWDDCPHPAGNSCFMQSDVFSAGTFAPKAIFNDRQLPTVTLGSTGYPSNRSVAVGFSVDEPTESVQCQLDDGAWTGCQSGNTTRYGDLNEGGHTLRVRAADRSGQTGYSDVRAFTIVDTALTDKPSDPSGSRTGTFSFSSVAGNAFQCQLDSGAWTACSSPHTVTVPDDGGHTFRVKALNGGLADPEPAEYSWRADTTAPETTLDPDVGPAQDAKVQSDSARFAFSSEAGATFECRFDAGDWGPCASPHDVDDLTGRRHTFEVRASDSVHNTDASPAQRSWIAVVDRDNDGSLSDLDCNDANPAIHPGATDVPDNGIDENCDGHDARNLDHDGDGHIPPADCDDSDASIHIGATDIPDNGIDENCDGHDAVDLDRDGDGHNRPADCNDRDPSIHVGATDKPENGIDENCDGKDAVDLDHDGDGHPRPADCNDKDASIHVGVTDRPENGVDENCDGKDAVDLDRDRDGYNRPQDCDDANRAISPGAAEVPGNAVDEDCNGGPAPYPSIGADVRATWRVSGARAQLLKLQVRRAPAGSKVAVQCRGKRRVCPFRAKRFTVSGARAARKLAGTLRGRWLRAGTRVTVTVTRPGTRGVTVRFVLRRGKAPARSERCRPATASDRC